MIKESDFSSSPRTLQFEGSAELERKGAGRKPPCVASGNSDNILGLMLNYVEP